MNKTRIAAITATAAIGAIGVWNYTVGDPVIWPDTIASAHATPQGAYTCAMEDGSDVIPALSGHCLWTNEGVTWYTTAERSYVVGTR